MYPKIFAEYFRQFERTSDVFVAMPISQEFEPRWKLIYKPAIRSLNLKPYRVDLRSVSDSILIDILRGIGTAKLVLADVSPQKNGWPNPNVMYELGLAHAMRLPEEVIVLRAADRERDAPFDIKHIRWHRFNPTNTKTSRNLVVRILRHKKK